MEDFPIMLEILSVTHVDHAFTPAHFEYIKSRFLEKAGFFIETFALPDCLAEVPQGLYGPIVGDPPIEEADVSYVIRGQRKCASRVVARPMRATRTITVVAGPHEGKPCVLYTAYGGPQAPREPGDTSIKTWEEVVVSREFWMVHALVDSPRPNWIRSDADVAVFIERVKDCLPDFVAEDEGDGRGYAQELGANTALALAAHALKHAIREVAPGKTQ